MASALGATLLVWALAWFWWIPAAVRGRVEDEASARLGTSVTVDDVSLGLASVELEDIRLEGAHGGLAVAVSEVELDAGFFSLAFSGTSAIDRAEATGIEVEIELDDPGVARSFDALREALAGGEGEARGPAIHRVLAAREIRVHVRDAQGDLLRARGGAFERDAAGAMRVGADELEIGGGEGHRLSLAGLTAQLGRTADGTLRLASASAAGGELVWAERERAAEDDPGDAPPSTFSRLDRLVQTIRGTEPEAQERAGRADEGGAPAWLSRLELGATIELGTSVVRHGEDVVLHDLLATVTRRGEGVLHFAGSGAPSSSGSLRWDLELEPAALRAAGTVAFEGLPLALVAPLFADVPWHEPEQSRLDGELTLAGEASEPISLSGRLRIRDAALYSARIAPEPVTGITVTLDGGGTFHPSTRRLEVDHASITLGEASAQLEGALEWAPDHYLIDVTATLPATRCSAAVGAIPRDLLADLSGFSWSGQIGGRIRARVDSRALAETELDIDVADGCQFETVPAAADLRRVQGPFLHRVLEPNGTWFEMTTGPGTANWASIHAISPFLIHAVLAHEDASFFRHGGFAPWAIRDALERNLEQGRYAVGASTITMQLAKNLFLHREKTLARKVQEVLLTWWLESALDKSAILELYLNVIEYGPGVYGIRNAAYHYFGREPSELSPAESAFLANILPNPKAYHHQYERNELSQSMKNRIQRLLRHMHARGRIDDAALEHGLAEIEPFRFHRGEELPAPREVRGSTTPLPFAGRAPIWDEPWESWVDDEGYSDGVESP